MPDETIVECVLCGQTHMEQCIFEPAYLQCIRAQAQRITDLEAAVETLQYVVYERKPIRRRNDSYRRDQDWRF